MTSNTDTNCPTCEGSLSEIHVRDNESGLEFCGALCHHTHFYGVRPPITQGEEIALEIALEWHKRHNAPQYTGWL